MKASPHHHDHGLHLTHEGDVGPVSFLNPTKRTFTVRNRTNVAGTHPHHHHGTRPQPPRSRDSASADLSPASSAPQPDAKESPVHTGVYQVWRSRDNRKGRHAVHVSVEHAEAAGAATGLLSLRATNSLAETWKGIQKMFVRYPVWDVSYDVAIVFTLGSVVWVINGFFAWLPLQRPGSEFANETTTAAGVSALVGATIFEFGSVLLMLEAVNENRADCFGWALETAWESGVSPSPSSSSAPRLTLRPSHDRCRHHHRNRRSLLGVVDGPRRRRRTGHWAGDGFSARGGDQEEGEGVVPSSESEESSDCPTDHPGGGGGGGGDGGDGGGGEVGDQNKSGRSWLWWPSWYELRTHYLREIGFLACFSQMIGATVFWISGFTALPSIQNLLSTPALNGVYWLPQVVGGTGFIISSFLFMIEVQDKWYIPAPQILGWHIGLWNLIGALGFTLCGALGFAMDQPHMEYALALSSFIGSWAFLIGSVVQWFESLDKYPISIEKGKAKPTKES